MPTTPDLTSADVKRITRDDALLARGKELAERGAVVKAWRRGESLLANVQGSDPFPYSVTLEPPKRGKLWGVSCTCPYYDIYHTLCKHGVAVLWWWATHPDEFEVEPTLDEQLAGRDRVRWLELVRESLNSNPTLQSLLALPPERKKPLRRAIDLAPFKEQLRFAFLPKHEADKPAKLARSVLESAAGYHRIGDSANALRIGALLVETLFQHGDRTKALHRLLEETLLVLEVAGLATEWDEEDHAAWITQVTEWWQYADEPLVADRLLDLILHTYSPSAAKFVIGWLRAQLRRPIHANQQSNRHWRQRILTFLLAYYETRHDSDALLDLCWEEGDDARAALELARQGAAQAILPLARAGLGSASSHHVVADLLLTQGYRNEAIAVADAGRGYHDRGEATLLVWVATRALEDGNNAKAQGDAERAWQRAPSVMGYRLLRAISPTEEWQSTRQRLLDDLQQHHHPDLAIEILIDEESWEEATTLLPMVGARRAELTETLARAVAPRQPMVAIELLFDLATLHATIGNRAAYLAAVRALLAARTVADSQDETLKFASLLQQFKITQRRRRVLLDYIDNAL